MTTNAKNLETRTLAISEIHVDPEANARKTYDEKGIDALAATMKADGLLNPVTVRHKTDTDKTTKPYVLVAGYRRMRAADALKWETIRATVLDPETKPQDLAIINLTENVARRDLSTYELAAALVGIRNTFNLSGEEISKRIKDLRDKDGLSKQSVNNYMRCFDKLTEEIKEAWQAGHEKATIANLNKIAAHDDEADQIDAWNLLCGIKNPEDDADADGEDEEAEDGAETDEEGKPLRKRPTVDALKLAIKAVRDSEQSDEWKAGAVAVLQWASGARARIPGLAEASAKTGKMAGKQNRRRAGVEA